MTRKATPLLYLGFFLLVCGSAGASQVDVNCTNTTADTTRLNGAIQRSHSGDQIRIHGICLIDGTIVLLGDRTYEGRLPHWNNYSPGERI